MSGLIPKMPPSNSLFYNFKYPHKRASPTTGGALCFFSGFGGFLQAGVAFRPAPAEDDDFGVALEAQPDVVLGGRALVGLELHPHLLDEVGVAA